MFGEIYTFVTGYTFFQGYGLGKMLI